MLVTLWGILAGDVHSALSRVYIVIQHLPKGLIRFTHSIITIKIHRDDFDLIPLLVVVEEANLYNTTSAPLKRLKMGLEVLHTWTSLHPTAE